MKKTLEQRAAASTNKITMGILNYHPHRDDYVLLSTVERYLDKQWLAGYRAAQRDASKNRTKVFVAFDPITQEAYINSVGSDETEALAGFGLIDVPDEVADRVEVRSAFLIGTGDARKAKESE